MIRFPVLSALLVCLAVAASAQSNAPWGYRGRTGPLSWGKLSPDYSTCADGRAQSPIDIRDAHRSKNLQPIDFHYVAGGVTLRNTGHTIEVDVHPGSYIVANGVRYNLESFEFHRPGEHAVNGRLTDMDVELKHRSPDGRIAILVARFVENMDAPNATMAALWQHLPQSPGATQTDSDLINPGGLLPGDRGYWTYMGSLTTPPCTEGVRWFILEQTVPVSTAQLSAFRSLYNLNSRPLQDRHNRVIEANQ